MKYKQNHFISNKNDLMLTVEQGKPLDEQLRMEVSINNLVALEKKAIYCDNCNRLFIPARRDVTNCGFCVKEHR